MMFILLQNLYFYILIQIKGFVVKIIMDPIYNKHLERHKLEDPGIPMFAPLPVIYILAFLSYLFLHIIF